MGGSDSGKLAGGVPVIESERIWRWPNHIVMSPSSLKTFSQCRFRIKLYYLQDIKLDMWVRAFAMGTATHDALATIARQMKVGSPLISEEQIRFLARMKLPLAQYPSEATRNADIDQIMEWVRRGRTWLERLDVEEWLVIEGKQYRDFPLFPSKSRYKLVAIPDLVMKRLDEDGQPYIHIFDWKTGAVYEEPDVPVLHRFALRDRLRDWIDIPDNVNVVFTWYWLDENLRKDVDVSVEHCNHAWPDILAQMEAMATETEWKATPGWYCRYCPYHGNYCNEQIPYED
jgi:hypothetical protein